jgi:hypothetical protein
MRPEFVVTVFFLLSLGAAWVLFKWLGSTAAITKKEYQLGGAAAGFLMFFYALYAAYRPLAGLQVEETKRQLDDCNNKLAMGEKELRIRGIVSPVLKNATVLLAVQRTDLGSDGGFKLKRKGLDLERDDIRLYVTGVSPQGLLLQQHYSLDAGQDTEHLKVNLEPENSRDHAKETH